MEFLILTTKKLCALYISFYDQQTTHGVGLQCGLLLIKSHDALIIVVVVDDVIN